MIFKRQWDDPFEEPCLVSLGFLYVFLAAFAYVAAHDTLWVALTPVRATLRWLDGSR